MLVFWHALLYVGTTIMLMVAIVAGAFGAIVVRNKIRNKQVIRYADKIKATAVVVQQPFRAVMFSDSFLYHQQLLEWAEMCGIRVINTSDYSGAIGLLPISGRVLLYGGHLHDSAMVGQDLIFLCKSDAVLYKLAF